MWALRFLPGRHRRRWHTGAVSWRAPPADSSVSCLTGCVGPRTDCDKQTDRNVCHLFLHQTDILMHKCLVCPVNRLCCLSREWVHPGLRQIPKLGLCQNTSCKFSISQVLNGYVCGVCCKWAVILTKYNMSFLRNPLRALTDGHLKKCFNTSSLETRHWTGSWASCVHKPSWQLKYLTATLVLLFSPFHCSSGLSPLPS
jgi:hypothetical protein